MCWPSEHPRGRAFTDSNHAQSFGSVLFITHQGLQRKSQACRKAGCIAHSSWNRLSDNKRDMKGNI